MAKDRGGLATRALRAVTGTTAFGIAGLANVLVASALLGADGYGQLTIALATAVLASSVGTLAMPAVITRECAWKNSDANRITLSALAPSLALATMSFAVLALWGRVTGSFLAIFDRPGSAVLLCAALVYALATTVSTYQLARFQGLERFVDYRNLLVVRAIGLGLPIATAFVTRDVIFVAVTMAASEMLSCLLFFRTLIGAEGGKARIDLTESRRLLAISWKPGVAGQAIALATWLGLLWVSQEEQGLTYAGWFGLGQKLATGAAMLGLAFVQAGTASLHAEGATNGTALGTTRRIMARSLLASSIGGIALFALAPMSILLGNDYAGSAGVIRIMALAVPLIVLNSLLSTRALAVNALTAWYVSDFLLAASFLVAVHVLASPSPTLALPISVVASFAASILLLVVVGPWRVRGQQSPSASTG